MKTPICISFCLAALTLVSCETRDQIAGHARITRLHQPTPVPVATASTPAPKPEPQRHVASQQQPAVSSTPMPTSPAPVASPLPTPAPKPQSPAPTTISQQQPAPPVAKPVPTPAAAVQAPQTAPKRHVASQQQPVLHTSSGARLPIASPQWDTPQTHRNTYRRSYPLMPGQNRGLKSRATN